MFQKQELVIKNSLLLGLTNQKTQGVIGQEVTKKEEQLTNLLSDLVGRIMSTGNGYLLCNNKYFYYDDISLSCDLKIDETWYTIECDGNINPSLEKNVHIKIPEENIEWFKFPNQNKSTVIYDEINVTLVEVTNSKNIFKLQSKYSSQEYYFANKCTLSDYGESLCVDRDLYKVKKKMFRSWVNV